MADIPRSRREAGREASKLYRLHAREIHAFVARSVRDRGDAEDATQVVFLKAYRALLDGVRVREPRAWLFTIARSECIDRSRATIPEPTAAIAETADHAADPAVVAETNDRLTSMLGALGVLSIEQREALLLRDWHGLSAVETANVLGITAPAVDSLVYRARLRVLSFTAGDGGTCSSTRRSLASGKPDRRARGHLLGCARCRAARASMRPQAAPQLPATIGARLGAIIPDFAVGGGLLAGPITAIAAKVLAAPTVAKVSALAAVAAVGGGGAMTAREVLAPPPLLQRSSADSTEAPSSSPVSLTREAERAAARAFTGTNRDVKAQSGDGVEDAGNATGNGVDSKAGSGGSDDGAGSRGGGDDGGSSRRGGPGRRHGASGDDATKASSEGQTRGEPDNASSGDSSERRSPEPRSAERSGQRDGDSTRRSRRSVSDESGSDGSGSGEPSSDAGRPAGADSSEDSVGSGSGGSNSGQGPDGSGGSNSGQGPDESGGSDAGQGSDGSGGGSAED